VNERRLGGANALGAVGRLTHSARPRVAVKTARITRRPLPGRQHSHNSLHTEALATLRRALAARRAEVHELHVLLQRAQEQPPPPHVVLAQLTPAARGQPRRQRWRRPRRMRAQAVSARPVARASVPASIPFRCGWTLHLNKFRLLSGCSRSQDRTASRRSALVVLRFRFASTAISRVTAPCRCL
jgi:hypothetical protein